MRPLALVAVFVTWCVGLSPSLSVGQTTTSDLLTVTFWKTATLESVRAEIARGTDPNARANDDWSPLELAAKYTATPAIITALVEAGADPNARDKYGHTPLHLAARYTATPAIITALVEAGADPNAKDKEGKTPMEYAGTRNDHPAVRQALARAVAPLTDSAFWETATLESVRAEIAGGADPNARDKDGFTPLHGAAGKTDNPAIITALLVAGADPNVRSNEGWTPLHLATRYNATPAITTALLVAGADPNVRSNDDWTPLHLATRHNAIPAIITALVEAGADPNVQSNEGWPPLHLAAAYTTTPAIITALVEAGADPNARTNEYGSTPLHLAAQKTDNPAIITALVEAGADPNAWSKHDRTPLHVAAFFTPTPAIITALVAAGADPKARDKNGKTPLEYAREHNEHPGVRQALARAMKNPVRPAPVVEVTPAPKPPTPSPEVQRFSTTPVAVQFPQAPIRPDDIAVIIGNADYTTLGRDIPDVKPAYADAEGIKRYVTQALGVREGNIIYLKDATGTQLVTVFGNKDNPKGQLYDWVRPHSRVFVYYSGHGAPAEEDGSADLVPVDADSRRIHLNGYPLATLHRNLAYLQAERAESVTLVLEACFSGMSAAGDVIPNSSRITVAAAPVVPQTVTVITAGAADQLASWEQDQSHGLFTKYFLLGMSEQADRNGDGQVTLTELEPYLEETLTYYARRYYGRDQVAQITPATR